MADSASTKRPTIKLPPEFKGDEAEFLRNMRNLFGDDEAFDHENRVAGVEDLKFLVGDQWEERVRSSREAKRKPVLTINRLPAFVAQVIGSRLQNETVIDIQPDIDGAKIIAAVRKGLLRSIQKVSKAGLAYDNALTGAVTCGIGNFQLELDYDNDEVWHQSIRIAPISDHFSVVWSRSRTDPTGADAPHCFVVETMPEATFRAEYPWATPADIVSDRMPAELVNSDWFSSGGDVRIVTFWQMREHRREIAYLESGKTVDITDVDDPEQLGQIAQFPDGSPMIRTIYRKYAQMYRCSGADVLEGPYKLPIDRVPVFRVPGWEIKIGDQLHRWGLLRFMKDPQRLHNFWRSAIAEKIMQSPRNTWVAADSAVSGREKAWRASSTSDDPLLIFNAESGQKPERVQPIQMEPALIEQAAITTQDLKDVSNIHEANLGMPSNEVSGRAIQERVRVSDTGTQLYNSNLEKAIEECGRVANQLIPYVYDTHRVVRVIGDDSKEYMVEINNLTDKNRIDITAGRYTVTVSTGPSYKTKRQEAADSMMGLATAMPNILSLASDLIVEAQDWPDADKIAARIRNTLPPGILSEDEVTPAIAQKMQQGAQQQQVEQAAAVRKAQSDFLKTQAEAAKDFAQARHYVAQTDVIPAKVRNESLEVASKVSSREMQDTLDAINVAHGR